MEMLTPTAELEGLTSRALIQLRCRICHQEFTRPKNAVQVVLKGTQLRSLDFCSRTCAAAARVTGKNLHPCAQCGKSTWKPPSVIKKSKHVFCSQTCSGFFNNKKRTTGIRRSRAEVFLASLIRRDFPEINLEENTRSFLPSSLEIDILLPEIKLAIELNGPIHYLPIYGQEKLIFTQNRDIQKQIEIHAAGYALIIINIQGIRADRTESFIERYYESHIKLAIYGAWK